jgi:hypothetical protein
MFLQLSWQTWTTGSLGALAPFTTLHLFGEGLRLLDVAPDVVADDHHDGAHQEGDPPAPGHERRIRHEVRQRQEDGRGEDLPGLHALEGEAGEEAAPAERRALEDHGAGPGDLAGDREALDEAQDDEEHGGKNADVLVGGQEADGHGREAHQEQAREQHRLAAVGVAVVAEDEGPDRPGDVAHAIGRQRRHDGECGVALGEEELREDQRGRGRVDEEIVELKRRADPAAGGRSFRLFGWSSVVLGTSHLGFSFLKCVELREPAVQLKQVRVILLKDQYLPWPNGKAANGGMNSPCCSRTRSRFQDSTQLE